MELYVTFSRRPYTPSHWLSLSLYSQGSSSELLILKELLARVGGCERPETLSEVQMQALAGGECLLREVRPDKECLDVTSRVHRLRDRRSNTVTHGPNRAVDHIVVRRELCLKRAATVDKSTHKADNSTAPLGRNCCGHECHPKRE